MNTENKNNEFDFFDNNNYEEETDFGDVIRTSHRTFGIFYLLLVVGIIIGGIGYLDNISWIGLNKYDDTAVLPVYEREAIPMKKSVTLAGIDVFEAAIPSEEYILKGQEVYGEYCTSCHGDNGKGDGAAGASLNPPPRNFHEEEGWTIGRKVSDIYKTLEEGILENGMSAYDYLPVEDRFALAHFIRSLAPNAPEDEQSDLQNIDLAYGLSEGKTTNNQVSLEKALLLVSEEGASSNLIVASAIKRIDMMNDKDVDRLMRLSFNKQSQGFKTLAKSSEWRASLTAFENTIRPDMGRNGFSSGFNRLTSEEKLRLYNLLNENIVMIKNTDEVQTTENQTELSESNIETN